MGRRSNRRESAHPFAARGGERNRTLTIIKARGTAHSNQLRELVLTHDGIQLEDVYDFEGELLLGTARFARELRDVRDRRKEDDRVEGLLRELEMQRVLADQRLHDADVQLRSIVERMAAVKDEAIARISQQSRDREELVARRSTDGEGERG